MPPDLPEFETDEEALTAAVQQCGGFKAMGVRLWPDVSPDVAARKLNDALNPMRPERLKPSQVRLILREARDRGYHAAAAWLMADVGYTLTPIDVRSQEDRKVQALLAATEVLSKALASLNRSDERGRP